MGEHRDFDYLITMFTKIGYDLHPNVYRAVYEETADYYNGLVSIKNFRSRLNVFLDALETGNAREWCRSRGVRM
jgi:hypothetical protein